MSEPLIAQGVVIAQGEVIAQADGRVDANERGDIRFGAVLVALFFLGLGLPPRLVATVLARMSLTQMADAADTVVRARCISTESNWLHGSIWTVTEFDVVESFKDAPQGRIKVRLPGGKVGHMTMNVEAAPRFQAGEEGVLFLEKTGAGDYSVTAWAQGTFRIRRNAQSGGEMVTQDSSALAVFDSATRQFRSEGVRNLPLDQFRRQLSSALAAGLSTGTVFGGTSFSGTSFREKGR